MIDWEKQQIIGCGLKTKKRKTTPLVIADFMIPVLRDLCDSHDGEKLLRMHSCEFYDKFDETLRRCGCRDLTPYACRHTTATELVLKSNIAPSLIQEIMRHSEFSTTQRYIHTNSRDALAAINTLNHNHVGNDVGDRTV